MKCAVIVHNYYDLSSYPCKVFVGENAEEKAKQWIQQKRDTVDDLYTAAAAGISVDPDIKDDYEYGYSYSMMEVEVEPQVKYVIKYVGDTTYD